MQTEAIDTSQTHSVGDGCEPPHPDLTVDPVVAHQQASKVIKRIRAIRRDRAIIEASYRAQLGEVELWWAQQKERFDRDLAHAELELRPLVELLTHDEKRKSISTPAGVAGFRSGRQSVKVDDADECMAWLTEHAPELVRVTTTREPDLRAVKARMDEGKVFPGLRLDRAPDAFYVDVIGEGKP